MAQRLLLHLGLHKTGTTFLQHAVWPRWPGVGYAGRPTPRGHASSEEAVASFTDPVILMSNESSGGSLKRSYLAGTSWQAHQAAKLEELKKRFAGRYDLGVLIGLRRPLSWIVSIYKHYLKYGGVETLDGFLGLEGTPPTLTPEDLLFLPRLRRIEETLGVRPFCFFLEEIHSQPAALSRALAIYAGTPDGPPFVSGESFNEGVNQAEADICLKLNRSLINRGCQGKGHIARNKNLGFTLARKWAALRGYPARPLSISLQASGFIEKHCREDLAAALELIASQRGIAVSELTGALNFDVPAA